MSEVGYSIIQVMPEVGCAVGGQMMSELGCETIYYIFQFHGRRITITEAFSTIFESLFKANQYPKCATP